MRFKKIATSTSVVTALCALPLVAVMIASCGSDAESEPETDTPRLAEPGEVPGHSEGSGGTPSSVAEEPEPIDCEMLEEIDPGSVDVELVASVDGTAKGGTVLPGRYRLVSVLRAANDDLDSQSSFQMHFVLRSDGTGAYTRKLGLSGVSTLKIFWSSEGEKFFYETICPYSGETLTYGYSVDEEGRLVLILDAPTTLHIFERED